MKFTKKVPDKIQMVPQYLDIFCNYYAEWVSLTITIQSLVMLHVCETYVLLILLCYTK